MKKISQNLGDIILQAKIDAEEWDHEPELLWPCFCSIDGEIKELDRHVFGGEDMVCKNIINYNKHDTNSKYALGSSEFWKSFALSKDIILVDMFFTSKQYERLYYELKLLYEAKDKENKDIYIFCNDASAKVLLPLHNEMKRKRNKIYRLFNVSIHCFRYHDWVHDRFAIMDQEIWHFGAAVGGMHKKLSAFSRGWKDEGDALRNFFVGG